MSPALNAHRAEKDVVNAAKADVKEAPKGTANGVENATPIAMNPIAKLLATLRLLPTRKFGV